MYECIDGAEGHTVVELHVSLWLNGSLFPEFSADFTWGQKKFISLGPTWPLAGSTWRLTSAPWSSNCPVAHERN